MERREDGPGDAGGSESSGGASAAQWSDARLIDAMRRNEAGSFREFFERFLPFVSALARVAGLPPDEREERVMEFLDDAALRLCVASSPSPRSLAAHLAMAFRRRVGRDARGLRWGRRLQVSCADGPSVSPAIERLALELERILTIDERELLAWLAHRVPQREIASWLGTPHATLRVRVARLRARLADAALRHAYSVDGAGRTELERVLRRPNLPTAAQVSEAPAGFPGGRHTEPEANET